jgi:hypothetical protein
MSYLFNQAETIAGFNAAIEADSKIGTADFKPKKLTYVIIEDETGLSYSKLEKFYECPRKFQLGYIKELSTFSASIHTAYGHAVGAGVQEFITKLEELGTQGAKEYATLAAIAAFDYHDIFYCPEKGNKSLWFAILAIEKFATFYESHVLQNGERFSDYEIATLNGKPAVELTFYIKLHGYNYQGHIDLILRNKFTGQLVVFELKTSKYQETLENWQNSNQALGYNVVLSHFIPEMADYRVIYVCYNASSLTFYCLEFIKSIMSRTEFLMSMLADVSTMDIYKELNFWPKRGSSCRNFGRACEYFGFCDNQLWIDAAVEAAKSNQLNGQFESFPLEEVDFVTDLDDLLSSQQSSLATETSFSKTLDAM